MFHKYLVPILLIFHPFILIGAKNMPPPVPGAGIVERELEKEYEGSPLEAEKPIPPIQIDIPRERLEIPEGMKVRIDRVEIEGNECLSTKELCCFLEEYLHCEMSLQEIYSLCHLLDDYYAQKGYFLARAYPPPQAVEKGTIVIKVIEGKLGNVKVVGNGFYSSRFIASYFCHLQGCPLQYDEFVKALMLLNDNTDLVAGAVFEKGEEFGYADVVIRVDDCRPFHLYLNGNNYGRNLTTNVRAGGRLDCGNFITYGDKLSIAEVVGFPVSALYFTDINYRIPLNRRGSFLQAEYLYSKFKIEELKSLHLKGLSVIGTLRFDQAIIRRQDLSFDFFTYFDYKQIQNFVLGHRTSYDKLRVLTVGTLLDHFSPNGVRDYLALRFAAGIPYFLGGLKPVDSHSSRVGGGGRFFIGYIDYDRIQGLPFDSYFYFHASGQYSPNKLTLPEQIYIGGVDTVRGFPLAVGLGDSGYYLNFELRIPPPFIANNCFFKSNKNWKDIIQFDAFLDQGGVFLHSEGSTFLTGAGVGVRIFGPCNFFGSIDVGFPLNHRNEFRSVFTYIKVTCQAF